MLPIESLLNLDLGRYSPDIVPTVTINQPLGHRCLFVVLDQWNNEIEQDLTLLLNSFQQTWVTDFNMSLIIYQNWFGNPPLVREIETVEQFMHRYRENNPTLTNHTILTLPPIEETHFPSILKNAHIGVLLRPNISMMGAFLAMNVPLVIPSEVDTLWSAPFIYRYDFRQPHSLSIALCAAISPAIFNPSPREFIQQKISDHVQALWETSKQSYKEKKYQQAYEMLINILYFIQYSPVFEPKQFATVADILTQNQQWEKLDQFIDARLFTPICVADSANRMVDIYDHAIRTCLAYIKGNSIEGDVLEFGTFMGFTASLITSKLKEYGLSGNFYAFDSFSGFNDISEEDQVSYEVGVRKAWYKGALALSSRVAKRLELKLNIFLPERAHVICGYFEDTLPGHIPQKPVAMVNIDCDLYGPARYVLDMLLAHGLLQDGTILLFDDFNCNRGNPSMGERRALQEAFAHQRRFTYSLWFAYGWSGQAVIVHDSEAYGRIASLK